MHAACYRFLLQRLPKPSVEFRANRFAFAQKFSHHMKLKTKNKTICSPRHSKHSRSGIGTLSSVIEVHQTICIKVNMQKRVFASLMLTIQEEMR